MPPFRKIASLSVAKVLAILTFVLTTLSGCIELQTPLSTNNFADEQLLGTWYSCDSQKSVKELNISRYENNVHLMLVQEQSSKGQHSPSPYSMTLTHGARINYMNIEISREKSSKGYMPLQYSVSDDKLHIWANDFDKLKALVEDKKLTANVNETTWGQNMFITTPGADVLKLFDAPDGAQLFGEEQIFSRSKPKSSINDTEDEIRTLLQNQADAWNAGDLDKFMTAYLNSPDISFISSDGEMRGYEALNQRYRKKYGNSKETMGRLSFTDLRVTKLGDSNALCIGHWFVERDHQPKLNGMFSLVLTRSDNAWKIIHDHTSLFSFPVNE